MNGKPKHAGLFIFDMTEERKAELKQLGLLLCSICPEIERNPLKLFEINNHEKHMTK